MTKEEYEQQLKNLNSQIDNLKVEYVLSNAEFQLGEKVEHFYRGKSEGFAQIRICYVGQDSKIKYIANKIKKDGSLSVIDVPSYNDLRKVAP